MKVRQDRTLSPAGIRIPKSFSSWIIVFLSASVLNLTLGCSNNVRYTKRPEHQGELSAQINDRSKIILLQGQENTFYVSPVMGKGDTVMCWITGKVADQENHYKFTYRDGSSQLFKKNDPHLIKLYVAEYQTQTGNDKLFFTLDQVRRLDYTVSEIDVASSILAGAAIVAGVAVVGFLIALSMKGQSCPFVYSYEKGEYAFVGEIYSGATYPSLERHDYLALGDPELKDGQYSFKIANKVKEIQHTNLAELMVVDHPAGTKAVMDKNGQCHLLGKVMGPVSAVNLKGADVGMEMSGEDTLSYCGKGTAADQTETDGVVLTFERPEGTTSAKLLIRAKNSLWLDYTFKRFHDRFGSAYQRWRDKQSRTPGDSIRRWMVEQNIPLAVSLKKGGSWQRIDQFNLPGPMAYREDVMALDISGADPGPLEVKLEAGTLFWELDYAGIDYSPDAEVKVTTVPLTRAVDEKGEEVTKQLSGDDGLYYSQPEIGNEAVLNFAAPQRTAGSRSVFLHSKGHYKILQDPSGRPDREFLEAFRQPGRFNRFSLELLQNCLTTTGN
jgi:hypothetical protein